MRVIDNQSRLVLLIIIIPGMTSGEKITLFYNSSKPQHEFAATDIKKTLESKNPTVEIKDLLRLKESWKNDFQLFRQQELVMEKNHRMKLPTKCEQMQRRLYPYEKC